MNIKMKCCLIGSLACLSLPVSAQGLFQPVELRDSELAELRGRYVLPDRVIHFGVTMTTFWQNSAGQAIGAQVNFQMNGKSEPSLHVTMLEQLGNGAIVNPGTGQVIGGAGLGSVQGVVQSVRSAGDYNDALNDLTINISSSEQTFAQGGQPWNGPTQFANGAGVVHINKHAGGLQIALQANHGQGNAQQTMGGGNLSQHANIGGNLNQVFNTAELNVALRERALSMDLANCAWEQMRALRPAGY